LLRGKGEADGVLGVVEDGTVVFVSVAEARYGNVWMDVCEYWAEEIV
jgi:hypothetical protein